MLYIHVVYDEHTSPNTSVWISSVHPINSEWGEVESNSIQVRKFLPDANICAGIVRNVLLAGGADVVLL